MMRQISHTWENGSSKHDSYGNDVGPWRENAHDDMVLAVALAAWYGEAGGQ